MITAGHGPTPVTTPNPPARLSSKSLLARPRCSSARTSGKRGSGGPARIHYTDIGDYLSREERLTRVASTARVSNLRPRAITPNTAGDWLNQRRKDFGTFLPIGDKERGPAAFGLYSLGLATGRDAWVTGSSNLTGQAGSAW